MSDEGKAGAPRPTAVELYRAAKEARQAGPTLWLDPAPPLPQDTLWRGLTRDGEIRILVARSLQTAKAICELQQCSADAAVQLTEALVAVQLLRSTVNPDAQMQLLLQHDGTLGQMVVDAWPDGGMRGYVANAQATGPVNELIGSGTATVVRYSHKAGSYRSNLGLAGDGIEDLAMRYLLESEQILGLLRLSVSASAFGLSSAAGYLLQVTPEGTHDDLRRLVENLDLISTLDVAQTEADPDGRQWATALMQGFRWDQCARQELAFSCRCSRERVLSTLAALPLTDLRDMVADGQGIETICEYCKVRYRVDLAHLAALLDVPS